MTLRSGGNYWTIFAYPSHLADDEGMPRDDESLRYFRELRAAGVNVFTWRHPEVRERTYFAVEYEDRNLARQAIEALERQGKFAPGFVAEHCERLFRTRET